MLNANQRAALRYWEIRRVILNALMIGAADCVWHLANGFNIAIDELPGALLSDPGVISSFVGAMLFFNVVYTLGYAAEFFLQAEPPRKSWPRPGRTILLVVLVVVLTGLAAKTAARLAYYASLELRDSRSK